MKMKPILHKKWGELHVNALKRPMGNPKSLGPKVLERLAKESS
jgi:hypothetical protein